MKSATVLADTKTMNELAVMQAEIRSDPANRRNDGSIHIFTPSAKKKLDVLAWAITYKLAEKGEVDGKPAPTDRYSGEQL